MGRQSSWETSGSWELGTRRFLGGNWEARVRVRVRESWEAKKMTKKARGIEPCLAYESWSSVEESGDPLQHSLKSEAKFCYLIVRGNLELHCSCCSWPVLPAARESRESTSASKLAFLPATERCWARGHTHVVWLGSLGRVRRWIGSAAVVAGGSVGAARRHVLGCRACGSEAGQRSGGSGGGGGGSLPG
jgi:hypothetical protein